MTARRDPLAEERFIAAAQRNARITVTTFGAQVREALETGQQRYGNSFATRGAKALIAEAAEETVDTACWATLAMLSVDRDAEAASDVHRALVRASAAACEAHAWLAAAERHARNARPR